MDISRGVDRNFDLRYNNNNNCNDNNTSLVLESVVYRLFVVLTISHFLYTVKMYVNFFMDIWIVILRWISFFKRLKETPR